MTEHRLAALVLAAGIGKRMRTSLPKVLHRLHGQTLMERVITVLRQVGIEDICAILSDDLRPFADVLASNPLLSVCCQKQRLGTGHAVASASVFFARIQPIPYAPSTLERGNVSTATKVLVVLGDLPAMDARTLRHFIDQVADADLGILAMRVPDPTGYGRLVSAHDGTLTQIIEERDATKEQKALNLCNTGVLCAKVDLLFAWLAALTTNNTQGEYYLTDCIAIAHSLGYKIKVTIAEEYRRFLGINTPEQLAEMEKWIL